MNKIYGFPTYNVTKVLIVAEEVNLPYEFVLVDLNQGKQREQDHLSRHPAGKVPVLETAEGCLYESGAICRFLARRQQSSLYPEELWQQANIDQMMDFSVLHVGRWLGVLFYELVVKVQYMGKTPDHREVEQAKGFLDAFLPVIDSQLDKQGYLASPDLSLADLILWPYFESANKASLDLTPYPNIRRWYEDVGGRDSVKSAFANY